MSKVTFLLPAYNAEKYIEQTLQSLLFQDYDDYDILCIDDGSTDRTCEIIEKINNPKIKYYYQENTGLVGALNVGLEKLDCEYVARIDADDICFSNRLSQQVDYISFTKADVISCRTVHIDEMGHPLEISFSSDVHKPNPTWLPPKEPYLSHPFMFGRLSVLAEYGYRNAHFSEDSDLCWRLFENHRLAIQNEVLGKYRLHSSSVSMMSVENGRIQSFFATISALNVTRRGNDEVEINYNKTLKECKAVANSIEGLCELFIGQLTGDEVKWVLGAANMKLLHIARWRGHSLFLSDIHLVENALANLEIKDSGNIEEIRNFIDDARMKLNCIN